MATEASLSATQTGAASPRLVMQHQGPATTASDVYPPSRCTECSVKCGRMVLPGKGESCPGGRIFPRPLSPGTSPGCNGFPSGYWAPPSEGSSLCAALCCHRFPGLFSNLCTHSKNWETFAAPWRSQWNCPLPRCGRGQPTRLTCGPVPGAGLAAFLVGPHTSRPRPGKGLSAPAGLVCERLQAAERLLPESSRGAGRSADLGFPARC